MQISRRALLGWITSAPLLPAATRVVRSQDYPSRPITMIVPYAAGGSADVLPRIIAERMRPELGQPVIIENVTGAAGNIGTSRLARAVPDGHTFGLGTWSTHVANPAIYSLQYDVRADFEPIAQIASSPMMIASSRRVPAINLLELLAWMKANPARVSQGTNGVGSVMHLAGLLLQKALGVEFNFIPYRGSAPAIQDMISGAIDLYIGLPADIVPQARAGTIRAHAIASRTRFATAAEVLTTDEAGLPDFYVSAWFGFWAPRSTPKIMIEKLSEATRTALADPAVRRRIQEDLHLQIPPSAMQTPEGLRQHQAAEIERWWPTIRNAKLAAE